MRRIVVSGVGAILLALTVHIPANASVRWICDVPGEGEVIFVTAADASLHGISTANAKAGRTFHDRFGEVCRVEAS
jgi:hypothetical protein